MSSGPRSWSRRWALAGLALLLLLAHGWLVSWFDETRLGWGARDKPPPRLQAAFVRELEPTAPPPTAPPPRPAPRRAKPKPAPAAQPASAPAEERKVAEAPAASEPEAAASAAPAPEPAASVAVAAPAPASAASQAQPFEWPPSTRLTYQLNGFISGPYGRGPLEGHARVQWIRDGLHYQVHLDVTAALVFTRRMTSDGELGDEGLAPKRFDQEETRFGVSRPTLTVYFEPEQVVMPDGSRRPRPPGVQDIASQLVQMTWLFTTRPDLLQPGASIDVPVAMAQPQRIEPLTYQVLEAERVDTPFGAVDTFHVKPRATTGRGKLLSMETWVAPGLQYLPVRVRISQDADNYLDLVIERKPQQSDK
jgi:hypothetical protein